MSNFFKMFLACLLAIIFSFFLIFFIFIISATAFSSGSDKPKIANNSVLEIDAASPVTSMNEPSLDGIVDLGGSSGEGFTEVLYNIEKAKNDPQIKAILLRVDETNIPIAFRMEMVEKLKEFKNKSGKPIYAYGTDISQGAYILACVADQIIINPQGMLMLKGYDASITFYKGLMDKLGIEPQILYAGKYKSATEPYRLEKMSDANREQTSIMVDNFWDMLLHHIAIYRKVNKTQLATIINDGTAIFPEDAQKNLLVDRIMYEDEFWDMVAKDLNWGKDVNYEDRLVHFEDYSTAKSDYTRDHQIALVHMSGEIGGMTSDYETEGISDTEYIPLLEELKRDKKTKAVLLHINSPGGDATMSDKIWHMVEQVSKVKPVVCYMSNVAASGGYYIACGAQKIFAQPSTITGSIGVFMMSFNAEKLLENKLGLSFDHVQKGDLSDFGDYTRPMTDKEKNIAQKSIDKIYSNFKKVVSEGRHLSMAVVDSIAGGRVYTGEDALNIGLIDSIGYLQNAIDYAAKVAKTQNYKIKEYPQREINPLSLFMRKGLLNMGIIDPHQALMERWYLEIQKLQSKNNKAEMLMPLSHIDL